MLLSCVSLGWHRSRIDLIAMLACVLCQLALASSLSGPDCHQHTEPGLHLSTVRCSGDQLCYRADPVLAALAFSGSQLFGDTTEQSTTCKT